MATRGEHYKKAEELLVEAREMTRHLTAEQKANIIAAAQVHATLASVPVGLSVRDS